ncbi:MAG: hypothetical protein IR153_00830 [Flavobacterium sp.]|nr:hypothetical protein [Flavobacterium sp.]
MMADIKLISKGGKFILIALPMFFIGPSVIYNAFMNQHTNWHYLVLGVGITVCILSVYFLFKGLMTIGHGLFAK